MTCIACDREAVYSLKSLQGTFKDAEVAYCMRHMAIAGTNISYDYLHSKDGEGLR